MDSPRNVYMAQWRDKNRESLRDYQREYMRARRAANPKKAKEDNRKNSAMRRAKNPEAVRAADRAWYHSQSPEEKRARAAKNRAASRNAVRAAAKKWTAGNPAKKNAETAKRRARRKQAMPPWVDLVALRAIYVECKKVSAATGVRHHVDHVVPLQHPDVCGLHVPWNLQIIPAIENARKSNKLAA